MEPQTQKTQIVELIRGSENLVITVSQKPDVDEIAAAIALAAIVHKLSKHGDAIISTPVPSKLSFLPTGLIKKSFSAIRDFVISVDVSTVEADKLKYVPEGKKLNIYVTPFNGNYSAEDVDFKPGDFHCDAIIALGANRPEEMDKQIADQKELQAAAKFVSISIKEGSPSGLSWNVPTASSLCELVMELAESLQPEILDSDIATSILTGITFKTDHFTNDKTTAKVMNLSAQLMAAGAQQATIIQQLKRPEAAPAEADKRASKPVSRREAPAVKPKERGQLEPSEETELPRKDKVPVAPPPEPTKPIAPAPVPPPPPAPKTEVPHRQIMPPPPVQPVPPPPKVEPLPPPVAAGPPPPPAPDRPASVSQVRSDAPLGSTPPPAFGSPGLGVSSVPPPPATQPGDVASPAQPPPASPAKPPEPPLPPTDKSSTDPKPDIEAARKAVEEATKAAPDPTKIQDRFEPHAPQNDGPAASGPTPPIPPPVPPPAAGTPPPPPPTPRP